MSRYYKKIILTDATKQYKQLGVYTSKELSELLTVSAKHIRHCVNKCKLINKKYEVYYKEEEECI